MTALSLLTALTLAAGFQLPEQSARSLAMAGTGAASAEGASTVFYNPGAMSFEDGIAAEASGIMLLPLFDHRSTGGQVTSIEATPNFAPTFFVEVPVVESINVGFGAFSDFGASIAWPKDWAGRFEGTKSSLVTYDFNAAVSWRFLRELSLGLGVNLVRGTVELNRQLDFVDTEGSLRLGGGAWGVSPNLGLHGRWMHDRLRAGATWRFMTPLSFSGRADFTVPPELQSQLRDQDVSTKLTLPNLFALGVAYELSPRLTGTVDLTYTGWSSFKTLEIDFAEDPSLNQSLRREWHDSPSFRAGVEYAPTREFQVRGGAGFDLTPSPTDTTSPSLPDASRVLVSVGAGYRFGNFNFDAGYLFAWLLPHTTTGEAFLGTYEGTAHVVALTLSFRQ